MYDRYHRKITYLRISVTDRCNLRCLYCMPAEGIVLKDRSNILSYEQIGRISREAVKIGLNKIRLTGGEPLIRKNIEHLIHDLKSLEGLHELTLTTNGILLPVLAGRLKDAGLDRVNISLDTLDPGKYSRLTRGGDIRAVFRGIEEVQRVGFRGTKLNMVLIPGFNTGEVEKMKAFCRKSGLILQRIHQYALNDRQSGMHHSEAERPLPCEMCNRIRLTADGKLKPCLFSNMEIPLEFEDIAGSLKKAVLYKPPKGTACTVRGNWEIGG